MPAAVNRHLTHSSAPSIGATSSGLVPVAAHQGNRGTLPPVNHAVASAMRGITSFSNVQLAAAPLQHQAPYIEIVEEPKSTAMRFRYQCEGRSAGTILGDKSTSANRTYPTIKVRRLADEFYTLRPVYNDAIRLSFGSL